MILAAVVTGSLGGLSALALRHWLVGRHYRYDDELCLRARSVWWVVPVAALATVALGLQFGGQSEGRVALLTTYAASFVWMTGLAAIDVDVRRLPDRWTLPAYPVAAALLAWCSWAEGDWNSWWGALAAGLANGAVYFLLAVVNPAGLGMGDVKVAVPLGMLTGWFGSTSVVLAFLLAFIVALVVGLVVALRSGAGRKATFPFGPPMLASAALVVLLLGPDAV